MFYSTFGLTYSRVCGRIIAYQDATTDAFLTSSVLIDGSYVDGVSLTHGSVDFRQHIWTFASALGETDNYHQRYLCSCSNNISWPYSTDFVGNDYFCDSGNRANTFEPYTFTPMIPSGMAMDVVPPAPAASSTILHGSARPSPSPPLMTWRSGSAMVVILKIHLSSYSSFMSSSYIKQ